MLRYISPLVPASFILIVLAWLLPKLGDGPFSRIETLGRKLAASRGVAIFLIGTAVVLLRNHDEFSYLLAGDTFAHGRLTNPPHPMWAFFETFHVIGIGGAVTCSPLPHHRIGGSAYGGSASRALAGRRFESSFATRASPLYRLPFRRQRPWDTVLLGLGAVILASSRVFEGFLLCLTVVVFFGVCLFVARSTSLRKILLRVGLPFSVILFALAVFMGYYNWRLTGDPFLSPYKLNYQSYFSTPLFIWQKARSPIHYLNPQFEVYYNESVRGFWSQWFQSGT
jgi:hypothetical protein